MFRLVSLLTILTILTLNVFPQNSGVVKTNGIKTHYLEWGKGKETIVLIHGLADTSEVWKDLAAILAKKYRVIAPDRRGAGKSERPPSNYDTQTLVTDVAKLLDGLKIKSAVVVGHSFGGNTALGLAANAPGKVKKLILIEGGFWRKREPAPLPECAPPVTEECLISVYLQQNVNEFDAERFFPNLRPPSLLIMGLPKELNKTDLNDDEKINKKFFDEAVAEVRAIAGKKLKKSKASVIEDAGHWVFIDQPEKTAREIENFIKLY